MNNPEGLAWHATIGENEYYLHMNANEWGWNARAASDDYIAVEFAQAVVSEPITDAQVDAYVEFIKTDILPTYPDIPMVFVTHADIDGSQVYGGTYDGKSDVFPKGDPRTQDLINRIQARLTPQPQPQPEPQSPYQFHFGFADKAAALGSIAGVPIEDEHYISDNYSFQMTTTGLMVYSKQGNTVHFLKGS